MSRAATNVARRIKPNRLFCLARLDIFWGELKRELNESFWFVDKEWFVDEWSEG